MIESVLTEINKHVSLSEAEAERVTQAFKVKKVRRNQFLVQPPDVAQQEHFVVKGCLVEYYLDDNGTQRALAFAAENSWMTDLQSFLTTEDSKYYVEALEDGEVLTIRKDVLDKLLLDIPLLNIYFRILYQNAIVAQKERLLNILSSKTDEHYLKFRQKYPHLENRVPQYWIASYLGVTPEFLSRVKSRSLR
ncbi:MAG: Crp/Fnr family transcriptional regulator [Mucilaginibacter sp.]|uniref:Crp/Fnr family transcriptional regulator n=1 Tax=Mucilaginibacter sp. TaxID=1882438 RepID=UPI0031AFFBC5